MPQVMKGVRIIEVADYIFVPAAAGVLSDWGADVIRIERPGNPEDFAARHDSDFQNKHRNKRGMALNLRSDEGKAIFYRLAARADVVVENFRPDVKERLGFDYETLQAKNPRIILATNSTVEGEATAHYLGELAARRAIRASRIAYGVPVGGELEYVDGGTLAHALAGRQSV